MRATLTILTSSFLLTVSTPFAGEARTPSVEQPQTEVLDELDEVLVTGRQPGPALWRVKSGSHVLWVLAEVKLIPQKTKWRSKQVEKVLSGTREVLAVYGGSKLSTPAELAAAKRNAELWARMRYLPDSKTLRDVLPAETYARFEAERAALAGRDKDIERVTPVHAANRLVNSAIRTLDLGLSPISGRVVKMAQSRKVKVTRVAPLFLSGNPSLTMSEDRFMNTCSLEGVLMELENGGARWKARANAWSIGDVKRLKQVILVDEVRSPQCEVQSSAPEDAGELSSFPQIWLAAAESSLARNTSTLAVVDASLLLSAGGLLDTLRNRGYEVVDP